MNLLIEVRIPETTIELEKTALLETVMELDEPDKVVFERDKEAAVKLLKPDKVTLVITALVATVIEPKEPDNVVLERDK
jgi:hypothetical protein